MTKLIYQDDDITCFFYQGNSAYLLITFAPANFIPSKSIPFWGYEFSKKNQITTIGLVAKSNNWYPDASIKKLKNEVLKFSAKYINTISYGTSMGGYGAIKHGRVLGANHTVAFAAQFSIDPAIVKENDQRYSNYFLSKKNKGSCIQRQNIAQNTYIIYDPYYPEDRFNAEKIQQVSDTVTLMVAPFMHHFPLELFIGSKNTLDLFSLILKRDNATIRKTIRKKRRKSQTRIRYLIELLAVRNPNLAATYYSKYNVELKADGKAWLCGVISDAFQKTDEIDKAKDYAIISVNISSENITFLRRLSLLHLKLEEYDDAFTYIKKAIGIKPHDVNLLNGLVSIYLKKGDRNSAFDILIKALVISPDNRELLFRISSICLYLKKTELALTYSKKAYEYHPKNIIAFTTLLKAYEQKGLFNSCLTMCDKGIEHFGINKIAELYLAVCINNNQMKEVNFFIEKYIGMGWEKIVSNDVSYQIYVANNDNSQAEKVLLSSLIENPSDANILFRLCTINGKMGNRDKAIEYASQAWKTNELDINLVTRYISTLIWFGEVNQAKKIISEAELHHPNHTLILTQKNRMKY